MADRPTPCGISIPQIFNVYGYDGNRPLFTDDPVDTDHIKQFVRRADVLGYDSLWVMESIVGAFPFLEPISMLSFVAALTDRARLGISVLVTPLRNPIQLAKALATLDQLSHGRLIAGIGIGSPTRPGAQAPEHVFGISPFGRVARFREGIDVMKALWSERPASFAGANWAFDDVTMEPKPLQRPYPPLWFGARRDPALHRAVELGNGWMAAGGTTFAEFSEQASTIRRHIDELGRDPSEFAISRRIYIAVDDDRERARSRLREFFGGRYSNADLCEQSAAFGSATECTEMLARYVRAGANHLMLNPVFDEMEQLEVLAANVLPHL